MLILFQIPAAKIYNHLRTKWVKNQAGVLPIYIILCIEPAPLSKNRRRGFSDFYWEEGTLYAGSFTWGNRKSRLQKFKWFAPIRTILFRKPQKIKYGLWFAAMQFFYSFESVQLIWIYFVAFRSPTTSNFIVLCLCKRISHRDVCCTAPRASGSAPAYVSVID